MSTRNLVLRIYSILMIMLVAPSTVVIVSLWMKGYITELPQYIAFGTLLFVGWLVIIMTWRWSKPYSSPQNLEP